MARGRGRGIVLLVLVALLAGGLYTFRGLIAGPWNRPPAPLEVSEAAAASADEKLKTLRQDGDTIRLSGVEFTSYLRYRMASRFAQDLQTPMVTFQGENIRVDGRIPKEKIPAERLGRGAQFVPDTVDVGIGGTVRTVANGRAAVRVASVSAAKFPVPRERYLPLLRTLRLPTDTALSEDEVAFQLPPGVGAARVEGGMLVLAPE